MEQLAIIGKYVPCANPFEIKLTLQNRLQFQSAPDLSMLTNAQTNHLQYKNIPINFPLKYLRSICLQVWIWQISITKICSFNVETDGNPVYCFLDGMFQCFKFYCCWSNWRSQQNEIIWSIIEPMKLQT